MIYSTTFRQQTAASQSLVAMADLIARAMVRVQSFGRLLSMPAPGVPEATAQLLRLADSYEESQPSYAADLRAAAMSAQRDPATLQ